jgi:hypothetical protein
VRLRAPSVGFVITCLVYVGGAGFLAWGFQSPDLDRIWTLDHELKIGRVWNLTDDDLALLRRGLKDYSGLGEALLSEGSIGIVSAQRDGWVETPEVTVVRTPGASALDTMEFDIQTPAKHLPMRITVRGENWKQKLQADRQGPLSMTLPPLSKSEIFTVDFKGKDLRADPSILRTRISFREGQKP